MQPLRKKLVGWALVIVFTPIAALTFTAGWIQTGWDIPEIQCQETPRPTVGGPFHETTEVTGRRMFFRLGLDCTYDVPGDGVGPQVVHNYNPRATIVLVVSALAAGSGIAMVNRRPLLDRLPGDGR